VFKSVYLMCSCASASASASPAGCRARPYRSLVHLLPFCTNHPLRSTPSSQRIVDHQRNFSAESDSMVCRVHRTAESRTLQSGTSRHDAVSLQTDKYDDSLQLTIFFSSHATIRPSGPERPGLAYGDIGGQRDPIQLHRQLHRDAYM
jgi:hypothetical protein